MVNNHADEAHSWVDIFKHIQSKEGKYSIFGNHDYADYGNFTPQERKDSVPKHNVMISILNCLIII